MMNEKEIKKLKMELLDDLDSFHYGYLAKKVIQDKIELINLILRGGDKK